MKIYKQIFGSIFILIFLVSEALSLTIKLGSLAPIGSPWDINLRKISAEWNRVSGGKIILKIYPGGIIGDEDDMIRKIQIGQLDAAGISGIGLSRIYNGILALQLPLLVRNNDELINVLEKMKPYFEQQVEKKGYKIILWNLGGWVHFFSKNPIVHPDDLKKAKMWVWEGDPDQIQAWKAQGFQPIPLPATEIMTSLQSGMVDALATNPVTAAAYQWFGIANHMCGLQWAPFIGGFVISKKTWNQIPSDLKPKLLEIIKQIGKTMEAEVLQANEKALLIMKQHKLVIHPVSEDIVKEWQAAVDLGFQRLVGKSFDKESYDKIKFYLDEYRKRNK